LRGAKPLLALQTGVDAAPLQLARGERSYVPLQLLRLTASLSLWERSSCSHVVVFTSGSDQSQTPGVSKLGLGDVSQLALGPIDSCEDAPGSRTMNFCAHHDCGEGMRLRRGSGGLDALPRVRARVKRSGCTSVWVVDPRENAMLTGVARYIRRQRALTPLQPYSFDNGRAASSCFSCSGGVAETGSPRAKDPPSERGARR
jgi:hypothetical protein